MVDRVEKKSERIEIRVSHSKKQAFQQACDDHGDTPSGALRRFIDGYIRRADQDALKNGLRALGRMGRHRWLPIGGGVVALLLGGFLAVTQIPKPALIESHEQSGPIVSHNSRENTQPIDYALFGTYDTNTNGVIDLGEIANNDMHLHRVLNIDGKPGISPAEFFSSGRMLWSEITEYHVDWNDEASFNDGSNPLANFRSTGPVYIIQFDLRDAQTPSVLVESFDKPTDYGSSQRVVGWIAGVVEPKITVSAPSFRPRDREGYDFVDGKVKP